MNQVPLTASYYNSALNDLWEKKKKKHQSEQAMPLTYT